jgi:hypothetical protein
LSTSVETASSNPTDLEEDREEESERTGTGSGSKSSDASAAEPCQSHPAPPTASERKARSLLDGDDDESSRAGLRRGELTRLAELFENRRKEGMRRK